MVLLLFTLRQPPYSTTIFAVDLVEIEILKKKKKERKKKTMTDSNSCHHEQKILSLFL